jgi:hypothetical protein
VYTAIFDNYDILLEPDVIEPEVDYVCFTDNTSLSSKNWEIKVLDPAYDPNLSNRHIKILAHRHLPSYTYSVYIDGNIKIKSAVTPLIEEYLSTADLAVYNHPMRDTVSEEARYCINKKIADESTVKNHIQGYNEAGFPDSEGLSENRILYRRHNNDKLKKLMESWWEEVSNKTPRDQLSLMFVLWKNDKNFNLIKETVKQSSKFQIHPHRPTGWLDVIWPYWIVIRVRRDNHVLAAIVWYATRPIYYFTRSINIILNDSIHTFVHKLFRFISKNLL